MTISVSFRCKACGENAESPGRYRGEICGFARAQWHSVVSGPDPARQLLLERTPSKGEKHWLTVRFPFFANSREKFWLLYLPPMSHENGWDDQPQEIPESSLIECRLLEVEEALPQSARIRIKVSRVLAVAVIAEELAVKEAAGNALDAMDNHRTSVGLWDRFTYLSWSFEGDAGIWAVIESRSGREHLILFGEWSWHTDWFCASNQLLSEVEVAILTKLTGLPNQS